MNKAKTVDEYIATFPEDIQLKLKTIRKITKATAPQATEKLSYGMPYYGLNGRLLYFAAFKDHISLFAMPSAIKIFAPEITNYQTSKGTIRFPLDKPLPVALIRKIIRYRTAENLAKK